MQILRQSVDLCLGSQFLVVVVLCFGNFEKKSLTNLGNTYDTNTVITACIRRMGKVIFLVCFSVQTWGGGGFPHLHPIILQLVPCPFLGVGFPSDWSYVPSQGVLQPGINRGTPDRSGQGVPQPGMGYPPG